MCVRVSVCVCARVCVFLCIYINMEREKQDSNYCLRAITFLMFIYLFWERERERGVCTVGEMQRERERETESQAGSELSAQSPIQAQSHKPFRS